MSISYTSSLVSVFHMYLPCITQMVRIAVKGKSLLLEPT